MYQYMVRTFLPIGFLIGLLQSYAGIYYVNDASQSGDMYCTQAGHNGNDGLTPGTPKLDVNALLSEYTLVPGDTVLIDTGVYTNGVLIGTNVVGTAAKPIAFQGATNTQPWGVGTVIRAGGDVITVGGKYLEFRDIMTVDGASGLHLATAANNSFLRIYSISNTGYAVRSSGLASSNVFRRCVFHSRSVAAFALNTPAKDNYVEQCIGWSSGSVGIGGQNGTLSNIVGNIFFCVTGIAPVEGMAGSYNVIYSQGGFHPSFDTMEDFNRVFTNWHHNTMADPMVLNQNSFDFHLLSASGFVSNGVWVTNPAVGYSPGIDLGPRK